MPDGLQIDTVLKPGVTWAARDAGGTRLVLKRLPDDCLHHGRLHPAVKLRLTRLREVPVAAFVNLVGVRTIDGDTGVGTEPCVVLVSEFVPGASLAALDDAARRPFAIEVRRLVESLHHAGLVHGAIGPGNVVVEPGGRVRLIDPSPLLYDDPATDLAALTRLLQADAVSDTPETRASPRLHWPTFVAALALAVAATAAAAGWAVHVAGRP